MKVAVLGAGRIGQVHAHNLHAHPWASVAVVADVREAAAKSLAEVVGARATTDIHEAISAPDVEAVLICTSTDTHTAFIEKCAERHRPVFCEKPIDLDLQKTNACLAAASKAGIPLMVGFNRRFDPHFAALHRGLAHDDIGALELLKITSRDPEPPPADYVARSGGLFRDMMIHDFDMARFLLGEGAQIDRVLAAGSCQVDPAIGEAGDIDTAVVTLQTQSGALVVIDCSRRAAYGYDQRIEAFGAKGMIQAGNPPTTSLVKTTKDGARADTPPYFFVERYEVAYRAELDAFLRAARAHEPMPVGGDDGRWALALAEAAQRSLDGGAWVDLADAFGGPVPGAGGHVVDATSTERLPEHAGRAIIVTGGTQGLGERVVHDLVGRGAFVLFCGRSRARGEQVEGALAGRGRFVRADLSEVAGCEAVLAAADALDDPLWGLVNAAASTARGTIDDTTVAGWDEMMALNLRAPFLLMQGAIARMRAAREGGCIVNIGSVSAHGGQPKLTAYCTSKGALATLTKNVAYAVRADRIRAHCLNVGWMATPAEHAVQKAEGQPDDWLAKADARAPLGGILRPEHVSHEVVHLMSERASRMTGAIIELNHEVVGAFD